MGSVKLTGGVGKASTGGSVKPPGWVGKASQGGSVKHHRVGPVA